LKLAKTIFMRLSQRIPGKGGFCNREANLFLNFKLLLGAENTFNFTTGKKFATILKIILQLLFGLCVYDDNFRSIIDIRFYDNFFTPLSVIALALLF